MKMSQVENILDLVSEFQSDTVFNPWADVCAVDDMESSPEIRRSNLRKLLLRVKAQEVRNLWIGRDCGYRGARRTGIPLVDEFTLEGFKVHFQISSLEKATRTERVKERTATEVWKVLVAQQKQPFTWNVFPYHPHDKGDHFSNRCHTRSEFKQTQHILSAIIDFIEPDEVVAIGNDAMRGLEILGIQATKVRHPSYGGQSQFFEQMTRFT